jgi:hypothetical protein
MTNRAPKFLLALIVAAAGAAAQETPAPPSPTPIPSKAAAGADTHDASSVVLAPRPKDYIAEPPTDSDGVTRSVSPGIAADLASGLPKYSPPTPTPTPAAESQDLQDVDKPKNEIKRLPKYIVRESRPPIFREQDLNTPLGQIDLSFKSHPGLLFGNFLGLNSGPAYEMYLDDLRQENIDELHDIAHAMSLGGDKAEGSYILEQSQDAYMRSDDNSWNLGGPGYGGGITGGGGK